MAIGHNGDWLATLRQQRAVSSRDWTLALVLSIFLGFAGADRFYLGSNGLGLAKLLTFGGFGLWWLVNIAVILAGRMRDEEGCFLTRK